jgi:L-lysine 2,3-aminomutase
LFSSNNDHLNGEEKEKVSEAENKYQDGRLIIFFHICGLQVRFLFRGMKMI